MPRSLPQPWPLPKAQPPLRQSCDRCHDQKIKCCTEGPDGASILGGTAEKVETSLSGPVISPVPCVRCKKARALCIYSPQLRSGRPRLRRDSNTSPPRRRARQIPGPSSTSLSPILSQVPSLSPSSRPSAAATFSSVGLGIPAHTGHDVVEGHAASQPSPLPSPTAPTPRCEQGSQHTPSFGVSPAPHEWLVSPSGSDSNQFLAGMCQLAPLPNAAAAPAIPCAPLFPEPAPDTVSTAEDVMYPWACSPPDNFAEELSRISSHIHGAGRVLLSQVRTLASLSSPAVNDIFHAAFSLINLVDRYAAKQSEARPQSLRCSPGIDRALDSSICLMIHACHHALLGIFEDLTNFLLHLSEAQPPTPPSTPPGASFQALDNRSVIMASLINNLLNQLDRAFSSLFSGALSPQSQDSMVMGRHVSSGSTAPDVAGRSWRDRVSASARVRSQVKVVLRQPECTLPV